jgi:hypothetical protein
MARTEAARSAVAGAGAVHFSPSHGMNLCPNGRRKVDPIVEVPFISVYARSERRVHLVGRRALAQRPNVVRYHFYPLIIFLGVSEFPTFSSVSCTTCFGRSALGIFATSFLGWQSPRLATQQSCFLWSWATSKNLTASGSLGKRALALRDFDCCFDFRAGAQPLPARLAGANDVGSPIAQVGIWVGLFHCI